jgi:hypothetical protein
MCVLFGVDNIPSPRLTLPRRWPLWPLPPGNRGFLVLQGSIMRSYRIGVGGGLAVHDQAAGILNFFFFPIVFVCVSVSIVRLITYYMQTHIPYWGPLYERVQVGEGGGRWTVFRNKTRLPS